MLTPPLALKVHEPYIRHESRESNFLVALFLVDQATRFVMVAMQPNYSPIPNQIMFAIGKGAFKYYVILFCPVLTPPPPLVIQNDLLMTPPSPPKRSRNI